MKTQLDEKQELINKIRLLCASDIQTLKVFVAGMDAAKTIRAPLSNRTKEKDMKL